MIAKKLYPLKFEPILQYRIWGGNRLAKFLNAPKSTNEPIGEAWVLSDRDDHPSLVANGELKGQTIPDIIAKYHDQVFGKLAEQYTRFPLLLKYLDAKKMLSVQVHPSDEQKEYLPPGEHGKTEAWMVLQASTESRIYAGLKPGTTAASLQSAINDDTVADSLLHFKPEPGDTVFIPAGTVHAMGNDVMVFEVQQNSDVTFRLYDWNHVDAKTGKHRELHIPQAMACIDFAPHEAGKTVPRQENTKPVLHELLIACNQFIVHRISGKKPFTVGAVDEPRLLVCLEGGGDLEHNGIVYSVSQSEVFLLPAAVGVCDFKPKDIVCLLEIALP